MMTKQAPPEVIRLTPDEIVELERLAAATGSTARRGPTAGTPSWRTLIKRMAGHDFSPEELAELIDALGNP